MSYGSLPQASGSVGTPVGLPLLTLVSQTGNANDKTLTLNSSYPWQYFVYDIQGRYIGSWLTPNGGGTEKFPLHTVIPLSGLTYPTMITLDIIDLGSGQTLNSIRMQIVGGDNYNVVITFPPNIPQSQGAIMVSVEGEHMMINSSQLPALIWSSGDVHTRGSDG